MTQSVLILAFLTGGQVALEENGEQVWASDDDDEFTEEFGDAFHDADDAEDILGYLVEEGILKESEAAHVEIEVESLEEDEGNGDDEDAEEDDGEEEIGEPAHGH